MVIALSVKNKLGFIDGSISPPENSSDMLNAWIRNNNMVISWILNLVSKEISASVIYSDAYFTKLKTIWEELSNYRPLCSRGKCVCGGNKKLVEHYQMEYVMSFLMGLHESFAQIRGRLLLMDPIPPINKVFALVAQKKNQRKLNANVDISNINESMAFHVKNEPRKSTAGQQMNKFKKTERPRCTYCGYTGHVVDKCYKLHGFPPGYKPKERAGRSSNQANCVVAGLISDLDQTQHKVGDFMQTLNAAQYQHLLSILNDHLTAAKFETQEEAVPDQITGTCLSISFKPMLNSPRIWVIDSGATSHIYSSLYAFNTMRPVQNASVTLPNNVKIPIQYIANMKLSLEFVLEDVLFVPQFKFNLISVSSLTRKSSLSITFLTDTCVIQVLPTMKMIGKGERAEDLYIIDTGCFNSMHNNVVSFDFSCNSVRSSGNINSHIWHHRLGHLSFKKLDMMKDLLKFDVRKKDFHIPCHVCPLAKQRRLSFVSNNHLSHAAFDLIHCDVWGPCNVATHAGYKYFLTLVDDCTRSDNAKELMFSDFFTTKGVIH
ncbi:uncharacterized protein LOC111390234 [Olea europaea var. sylvestris]|uniref:uncharacterized protein LOC111390234 n=1 Tax=Olea europaea var. sylvestris TaxID=158386 RepID=UPI000C1D6F6C|nr:uncharacterized protein LOC111390234 [Olea europaea var. sylvestris]